MGFNITLTTKQGSMVFLPGSPDALKHILANLQTTLSQGITANTLPSLSSVIHGTVMIMPTHAANQPSDKVRMLLMLALSYRSLTSLTHACFGLPSHARLGCKSCASGTCSHLR